MYRSYESVGKNWGIRINEPGLNTIRRFPEWATKLQEEEFQGRGVIIWSHLDRQINCLSAQHTLQILAELLATQEWKTKGIQIGEPATELRLGEPDAEPKKVLTNLIYFGSEDVQELINFLNGSVTVLDKLKEIEEAEKRYVLGRVYGLLHERAYRRKHPSKDISD